MLIENSSNCKPNVSVKNQQPSCVMSLPHWLSTTDAPYKDKTLPQPGAGQGPWGQGWQRLSRAPGDDRQSLPEDLDWLPHGWICPPFYRHSQRRQPTSWEQRFQNSLLFSVSTNGLLSSPWETAWNIGKAWDLKPNPAIHPHWPSDLGKLLNFFKLVLFHM